MQSSPTDKEPQKNSDRILAICKAADIIFCLGAWAIFSYMEWYLKKAPENAIYALLILTVITLIQLLAYKQSIHLNKVSSLVINTTVTSTVLYILTILHTFGQINEIFGIVAFVTSLYAVCYLLWLVTEIEKPRNKSNRPKEETRRSQSESAIGKIVNNRLALLLYGFASFLGVTLLLGYAWLFHDKACRSNRSFSPYYAALIKNIDREDMNRNSSPPPEGKNSALRVTLYFDKLRSEIKHDLDEYRDWIDFNVNDSNSFQLSQDNPIADKDNKLSINRHNNAALMSIIKFVNVAVEKGNNVFITIIGKASDEALSEQNKSSYRSNFELSHARALRASYEIARLIEARNSWLQRYRDRCKLEVDSKREVVLKEQKPNNEERPRTRESLELEKLEQNVALACHWIKITEGILFKINWQIIPVSYELDNCRSNIQLNERKPTNCYAAEVWVSETRKPINRIETAQINHNLTPLDILDYIYFSTYTITTTAYGDIIPVTPWAQFLTIIANFYELIFLVIFFNVVLNGKRRG